MSEEGRQRETKEEGGEDEEGVVYRDTELDHLLEVDLVLVVVLHGRLPLLEGLL